MGYSEMDGCSRCMKYSLFFTNFIIFVGGATAAGLAIYAIVQNVPTYGDLINNGLLTSSAYLMLAGGILVAVIAFFGCLGACREVKCMLYTYFLVIFMLFLIILVGGILGYIFRDKVVQTLEKEMELSMKQYGNRDMAPVTKAWDVIQETAHCCGVNSYKDWQNGLPQSCCREIEPHNFAKCTSSPNSSNAYTIGCLNGAKEFIEKHSSTLGAVGIAVACLMFFGMIFSCALAKSIR